MNQWLSVRKDPGILGVCSKRWPIQHYSGASVDLSLDLWAWGHRKQAKCSSLSLAESHRVDVLSWHSWQVWMAKAGAGGMPWRAAQTWPDQASDSRVQVEGGCGEAIVYPQVASGQGDGLARPSHLSGSWLCPASQRPPVHGCRASVYPSLPTAEIHWAAAKIKARTEVVHLFMNSFLPG